MHAFFYFSFSMRGFITDCLAHGGLFVLYQLHLYGSNESSPHALACAPRIGPWLTEHIGWIEGLFVGVLSAVAAALIVVASIAATLLFVVGGALLVCRCLCCCCPRLRSWPTSAPIVPPYHGGILPPHLQRRRDNVREEGGEEDHEHGD